jgi:hypothetical protein
MNLANHGRCPPARPTSSPALSPWTARFPGKGQSWDSRMKDWHEFTDLMVQRFDGNPRGKREVRRLACATVSPCGNRLSVTRRRNEARRIKPTAIATTCMYAPSNDDAERRGVAPTSNEAALPQSSTPSLAHRRRGPRSHEPPTFELRDQQPQYADNQKQSRREIAQQRP